MLYNDPGFGLGLCANQQSPVKSDTLLLSVMVILSTNNQRQDCLFCHYHDSLIYSTHHFLLPDKIIIDV